MIAWNQSSDPGDEPPELLLPAKVPGTNSTTACVTYLAHGPVFAVGVWYKSRERILAEGTQLWTKANGSAFGSSERRMFRLYLAKVLAIPEPNWMDLGRWMDIGAELPSEEAFRAEFERAINDLPDDHGFKLVKSADRLRLAVGLGDSLKSDLGHCANFLKSIQQDDKEAFLDTIFVVAPLPDLDKTGALFIDAPGTNDVYVLRSRRCEQALEEAEVVLHLTGSYGVAQSDHDRPYLAPYWKVSNTPSE